MSDMYKDLKNTIQSLSTLGDDLALKTLKDLQEAIQLAINEKESS